jgi:hypothetical protein
VRSAVLASLLRGCELRAINTLALST